MPEQAATSASETTSTTGAFLLGDDDLRPMPPQYGEHCYATYWLDPHGFKLEGVCHRPEES
jgi:hypothetical protein